MGRGKDIPGEENGMNKDKMAPQHDMCGWASTAEVQGLGREVSGKDEHCGS